MYDSGIVVINDADSHAIEWIRFWNLAEPFVVYTFILLTIWSSHLDTSFTWIYFAFGAQFLYLVFISPILHYILEKKYYLRSDQQNVWFYFLDARGLGSPRRFFCSQGKRPAGAKEYRKEIIATIAGIGLLSAIAVSAYQEDISRVLGIEKERVFWVWMWAIPVLLLLLVSVILPVMVKWENYKKGIISFLIVSGLGVLVIVAGNLFFRVHQNLPFVTDPSAQEKWSRFSLITLGGQFTGYLFWAFAQQFLFLSIFSTNFARAFDIRGNKGFLSAVFCSALFFGLIHLPNIWLFAFSMIVGFLWSFCFMKTRNLFAIALSHGLLASLFAQLIPVSLSLGIKAYSGPVPLYFLVRAGIFIIIPLCFAIFCFVQGNGLALVKTSSIGAFAVLLFALYPNSGQGPDFYWGNGANGQTWRPAHQMVVERQGDDFTEYLTTGPDGFIVSQPLQISAEKAKSVSVDMELAPFVAGDTGVIYFDTGNGFNRVEARSFVLQANRKVYTIRLAPSKDLFRLRLDPSVKDGQTVRLYSLKIMSG